MKYTEGTAADGEVVSLNTAGAVVKLEEGVEGLIQKSDCPDGIKVGDKVSLKVSKHLPRERRFILVLEGAPAKTEEQAPAEAAQAEETPAEQAAPEAEATPESEEKTE